MVVGIEKFREHFAGHEDQYALVGGAACDLIFADAGLAFRATKDLDVVLCVEVVNVDFASAFLGFIEAGGYAARQRSDGHKEFYRFHEPKDDAYPFMIELFSRQLDGFELPAEFGITKVPVDEDILSLSAILLDDEYYAALQQSRVVTDGISLLSEDLLIPFKARAYLDLTQRRSDGDKSVKTDDIEKHRRVVFRLTQLLPADHQIEVAETIADDLRKFLNTVRDDNAFDPLVGLKVLNCWKTSTDWTNASIFQRYKKTPGVVRCSTERTFKPRWNQRVDTTPGGARRQDC